MTEARPPGWYDEPGGDRGVLRWWDGRSWTSVTRLRSPAETPPSAPTRPADLLDSGPDRPPSRARRGWVAAGAAAAVVALVVVTGPVRDAGTDGLTGSRTPLGPATVLPPEPAPTTPTPVTGRVSDRVARLSYDVLPGRWRAWDRDVLSGMVSTIGYYRVTQENAPNAQTYWANVNSGPVAADTAVPGDLAATARRVTDRLAARYYPPHTRSGLAQTELRVDGAAASLVRYRAVFDPTAAAGYSARTEEVVVLVVDVGTDTPSALYVSVPDTVATLWPSIDPLLASVRVLR